MCLDPNTKSGEFQTTLCDYGAAAHFDDQNLSGLNLCDGFCTHLLTRLKEGSAEIAETRRRICGDDDQDADAEELALQSLDAEELALQSLVECISAYYTQVCIFLYVFGNILSYTFYHMSKNKDQTRVCIVCVRTRVCAYVSMSGDFMDLEAIVILPLTTPRSRYSSNHYASPCKGNLSMKNVERD